MVLLLLFFVQQGGRISRPSKKFVPQLHMASSTGIMLLPNGVSEYKVLGGLSGMTSRCIIPHSSRSCNCCDSICDGLLFRRQDRNYLEIHSYVDNRRILLTFNLISPILLS